MWVSNRESGMIIFFSTFFSNTFVFIIIYIIEYNILQTTYIKIKEII